MVLRFDHLGMITFKFENEVNLLYQSTRHMFYKHNWRYFTEYRIAQFLKMAKVIKIDNDILGLVKNLLTNRETWGKTKHLIFGIS